MPSRVRMFWWVCILLVIYWAFETIWLVTFPAHHYLAALSKLPIQFQSATRSRDIAIDVVITSFWSAIVISLAAIAAFRRSNMSRLAIVFVFLGYEMIPLIIPGAHDQFDAHFGGSIEKLKELRPYVSLLLELIAVTCAYSGNARAWFKTPSDQKG